MRYKKYFFPKLWHAETHIVTVGHLKSHFYVYKFEDYAHDQPLRAEINSITHLTPNLSACEIKMQYGSRLCSRMRIMFNLIALNLDRFKIRQGDGTYCSYKVLYTIDGGMFLCKRSKSIFTGKAGHSKSSSAARRIYVSA